MSQTNLTSLNKFKVGDVVKRIVDGDPVNLVTKGGYYTVVSLSGDTGIQVVDDIGQLDVFASSNFILDKNQIVINILNDL